MKIILTVIFCLVLICSIASAASMSLVSDTTNQYWNATSAKWEDAVATWQHSAWIANIKPDWLQLTGATWIWNSYYSNEPNYGETVVFRKTFELPRCDKGEYYGEINITADNEYTLKVNGHTVGTGSSWLIIDTYDIGQYLHAGENTIEATVFNNICPHLQPDCGPECNPGGLLYSAEIRYDDSCQVPEFTTIGAGIALIGAGAVYLLRKKK